MSKKLVWDEEGTRKYYVGVDKVALFVQNAGKYGVGVAWQGVSAINENPSGAEDTEVYADNMKYANVKTNEKFSCTIEAYDYPDEWMACDGQAEIVPGVTVGQQKRATFGLVYRSNIGSDADEELGYIYKLVYGCQAKPASKNKKTINENVDIEAMSWEVSTTPVKVDGFKPLSTIEINSLNVDAEKLASFLEKIYGSETTDPTLPSIEEVFTHFGWNVAG